VSATAPRLLLILKWGGEQTLSGQNQAEELGRAFRIIYPGGEGEYASLPGSGFLRLHSTYRHDLKVYASDEGRVQMTAASFTKVSPGCGGYVNFCWGVQSPIRISGTHLYFVNFRNPPLHTYTHTI